MESLQHLQTPCLNLNSRIPNLGHVSELTYLSLSMHLCLDVLRFLLQSKKEQKKNLQGITWIIVTCARTHFAAKVDHDNRSQGKNTF